MRNLIFICYTIGFLLVLPAHARCAQPPFCRLGSKSIDLMNGIFFSPGKISPVVLTETIAFAEECPASVVPAFKEFADNEQELHRAWLNSLKAETGKPKNADLRELLWLTRQKFARSENSEARAYLGEILSVLGKQPEGHQIRIHVLFERVSLAALKQFPRTDGAGGFDQSDFLLFLLATHPVPFLKAVHEDQQDTSTWLSQLGAMSFAGIPTDRERREAMRERLLRIVSNVKLPELAPEKYQIESALRRIHFRAYQ